MNQSLEDDLALWADLGIDNVGLIAPKLEAGRMGRSSSGPSSTPSCGCRACRATGTGSPSRWISWRRSVRVLYTVTGSARIDVPWEEAAEKFCEEMAPRRGQSEAARCPAGGRADQPAANRRELRALRPGRDRSRPHGRHRRRRRLLLVLVRTRSRGARPREHRPRRAGADQRLQARHLRHAQPMRHRRWRHPGGAPHANW